jgi:UDP-N-acetyl-D-mannosaminuronic acid dehydrogenase
MPGRLVERVAVSDKLVAGLHPLTPQLIQRLYSRVVTRGTLHATNSMTAEIVKTLENAYRDVRIAFSAEIVRYCDQHDVDFYALRDLVNERLSQSDGASQDPTAIPTGGMLIPTIGVGGHCLPKDGILLWWRKIESGADTARSLILQSRIINDESPSYTIGMIERRIGNLSGKNVALLGMAYRPDSEDTRNSPTSTLAGSLLQKGCRVTIHDPYVRPMDQNLQRFGLAKYFTNRLAEAVRDAEIAILCAAHGVYHSGRDEIIGSGPNISLLVDGANLFHEKDFVSGRPRYIGIGRGHAAPTERLVDFVEMSFRTMEHGVANELRDLIEFLNDRYAVGDFNRVDFEQVRRLAATCGTGCVVARPSAEVRAPSLDGFKVRLTACAESK